MVKYKEVKVSKLVYNKRVVGFRFTCLDENDELKIYDTDKESIYASYLPSLVNCSAEKLELINKKGVLLTLQEKHADVVITDISNEKEVLDNILLQIKDLPLILPNHVFHQSTIILDKGIALFGLNATLTNVTEAGFKLRHQFDLVANSPQELKDFLSLCKWQEEFDTLITMSEKGELFFDIEIRLSDLRNILSNGYKISAIKGKTAQIMFLDKDRNAPLEPATYSEIGKIDRLESLVLYSRNKLTEKQEERYKSHAGNQYRSWLGNVKRGEVRIYDNNIHETVWEMVDYGILV